MKIDWNSEKGFWIMALSVLAAIGIATFVITYFIRSAQIDNEVANVGSAVGDLQTSSPGVDIAALKVGYDHKTYTLDEFVELDEIPVVVDILIMQENGVMSNKQAYVSCATDDTDEIHYVDGVYGRLILPKKYSDKVVDGNAG